MKTKRLRDLIVQFQIQACFRMKDSLFRVYKELWIRGNAFNLLLLFQRTNFESPFCGTLKSPFFLKGFFLNFELEKNEKYNITVIVRKNRKVQIQYRKSKPFTLKK